MALVLAAVLAGGCGWMQSLGLWADRQPPPVDTSLPPPGPGMANAVELAIYFVAGPRREAAVRFAADYWKHADEEALAPDLAALYAANGFRVGLAGPGAVTAAEALTRKGASGGLECTLRRLRVPHRGHATVVVSRPAGDGRFLLTRPGRPAEIETVPGASVSLTVACRRVGDDTVYLELQPRVLRAGRGPEDTRLLDFLATELAVKRGEAVLVGLGSPLERTVGRRLMVLEGRPDSVERLILIAPRPVVAATAPTAG